MKLVTPEQFPFVWFNMLPFQSRKSGNQGTKQLKKYKDIVTAFDIETTRLAAIEQSIMYIWQWAFGDQYCVIGRTWDDFIWFRDQLCSYLEDKERLVVYVHNLSFDFQFLRGVYHFRPNEVFAIKSRKILKADMMQLEFRCSYIHSNMSLAEYLDKMGAEHQKLSGEEYDYTKQRLPWTELTARELEYCANDVIGLVEALTIEMRHDGDNLYTVPLTSTGYVRRDAKHAMREVSYTFLHDQLPTYDLYVMLREAFRGGDTHANRFYVGQTVRNVHDYDRSSSYPDIVCNCLFPVSEFFHLSDMAVMDYEDVIKLIAVRKKAVIARCAIHGLRLIDSKYPAPYLSRDKCRNILGGYYDNGRILSADYLECTITDIDLRIIMREYKWTNIVFYDVAYARYGPLPRPLIDCTIDYYRQKTKLKDVDGQEVFYMKSKNKLNSIYGMMAQDPVKQSILFTEGGKLDKYGRIDYFPLDESKTKPELLEQYNRRAFLVYQWGCWVTAWARYRLREGIWLIMDQGAEWLYSDTDSNKYFGDVDWSEYNRQRMADSIKSGAYADDPSGKRHYMGVYEKEQDIIEFRTQGAKKYVYTIKDKETGKPKLKSTIAGVAKSAGARELVAAGGVSAFVPGFVFHEAGGLEAIYNDDPAVKEWHVDGHTIKIGPNITLVPSTYTVSLEKDYERLLRNVQYSIDF